jgi:hypothetical protein
MTTESEPKDVSFNIDNLINQFSAIALALSHFNALNNNNIISQRQNIIRLTVKSGFNIFTVKTMFPSASRYFGGTNFGGFGIARRLNSENIVSRNKCWWDYGNNHMLFRYYNMANWI